MSEYSCDFLVIGGGAAGMAAPGISRAAVGGNGLFPRGVFGIDSTLQKKKLIFADTDKVFKDCMEYSHWKIDGRVIRALIDRSGQTIDWLMEKGVDFDDVVHHIPNQSPEVFHIISKDENSGRVVMRKLKEDCVKRGVTILTGAKGVSLKKDGDKVTGAICEGKDGESIDIASKKTLISTGGFAGNDEMVRKYYPHYDPQKVPAGPGMRHTGEGIRMALEAGAGMDENFTMEIAAPKIQGYIPLNILLGKPSNVWLNMDGRRFADEGIVYNFAMAANAVARQKEGTVYVLFSEEMKTSVLRDGMDMIEKIHIPEGSVEKLDGTIEEAIRDKIMVKASNEKELADFIGADVNVVRDSIDEYNSFVAGGRDGWFAKDRRYLSHLAFPIYAVKAGRDMLITHGGVRVDEGFHALRDNHSRVEGLFVAGVDIGGADADIYNVEMSGHGIGFALNSGRIAAITAAEEIRNA